MRKFTHFFTFPIREMKMLTSKSFNKCINLQRMQFYSVSHLQNRCDRCHYAVQHWNTFVTDHIPRKCDECEQILHTCGNVIRNPITNFTYFRERIAKVLIRLKVCTGWPVTLLYAYHKVRFFLSEVKLYSKYTCANLCACVCDLYKYFIKCTRYFVWLLT